MHVFSVRLYAHAIPLDANSRTFLPVFLNIPHLQLLQGALICIAGLGLLVGADQLTNKDWEAVNKGKGDAFMILGATLYGFSASSTKELTDAADGRPVANATEEFFVRRSPLYEVVGQLGMWGTIIGGVQAAIIEHNKMKEVTWSGRNSV
jgi:solute carrier family 35 protein F1/2